LLALQELCESEGADRGEEREPMCKTPGECIVRCKKREPITRIGSLFLYKGYEKDIFVVHS
jgi:hypothetical protein